VPSHSYPEWLLYFAVPLIAALLFLAWLIYASRGKRAVTLNFKGFGISVDIKSESSTQIYVPPERP